MNIICPGCMDVLGDDQSTHIDSAGKEWHSTCFVGLKNKEVPVTKKLPLHLRYKRTFAVLAVISEHTLGTVMDKAYNVRVKYSKEYHKVLGWFEEEIEEFNRD